MERGIRGGALVDPTRKVKALRHSLPALLTEVSALFPDLPLSTFAPVIEKFRKHYQTRYPDNPDRSTTMSSADVFELDGFIVLLNENLPCPRNVQYRTGFYAAITFSLGFKATVTPTELWIKDRNSALAPLWPRIKEDYSVVMKELYP